MTAYDRATIAQAAHHDTALRAIRAAQAALAEPRATLRAVWQLRIAAAAPGEADAARYRA